MATFAGGSKDAWRAVLAVQTASLWLDGELSATEAQAVSAHLDRCAECSALAEQFRSTSLSLSRWNVEAVPARLEHSVTSAAVKAGSGVDIGKANIFLRASFWTWEQWALGSWGTLAALLLVMAIFLPTLHRSQQAAMSATFYQGKQHTERDGSAGGSAGKLPVNRDSIVDQQSKVSQSRTAQGLVTLTSPGIEAGSNGVFHGLGDHAEKSFSVDGQPVTDHDKVTSGPMIARGAS